MHEARVLNRVICWQAEGLTYEADPRHAEIVIRDLGLDGSKPVNTPGTREEATRAILANGQDFSVLDPESLRVKDKVKRAPRDQGPEGVGEEETLLQGTEATTYRALCARLN